MSIQETPLDGRRRDATKNREMLLRAARAAIAENAAASLDTIAQAAGLTRRAVYGHFPDRDALVREVIADGAREFGAIAEGTTDADPRLALAHLATELWRASVSVRASVNIAATELYRADTAHAFEPLRRKLAELTRAGIGSGALRGDMSAEVLAMLIEEAAKATLRDQRITEGHTAETAIKVVLSIAGLSWREQDQLLAAHPSVLQIGAT
ncbi:MAG: TetR/AcrR family transcriptional regulator [Leucobacter sp.]